MLTELEVLNMKVSLEQFIKDNELLFEEITIKIIDNKAYFVIDDGTLIEGNYEELIEFKD